MKLAVALAFAVFCFPSSAVQAKGVAWEKKSDVLTALAKAKKSKKRLLLEFTATWCSACKALKKAVLATSEGARLTKGMIALQVDFDDPKNRRFVEKYVVLGLPTTVVLKPDGSEAGRIMGFSGKDAWTKELTALRTGEVSIKRLEAQLAKHPDDPATMRHLGQVLLERGHTVRGQAFLEKTTWLAPKSEAAAHALFVLGRYFHRVKQEPETARHIWRELASRFPETGWAGGAWWWYARAQAEINQPAVGAFSLRQWANHTTNAKTKLRALRLWGTFVVKHKLKALANEVLAVYSKLDTSANPDEKARMDALVPKLKSL